MASREIHVIDDQKPEDLAMLQALYSRSPASVVTHLDKLKQVGSGKFMEQYYVGYGHASIGDCGVTTAFIEQVSILAAKAIQETPLYSGQEASTRYLDYSKQTVIDPYSHPASAAIGQGWMNLYNSTLPLLISGLKLVYPFNPQDYRSEKVWENAISARAFDIARALLPAGVTTLLSWTTNLRQARDHLRHLKHHPLPEVREVAQDVFDGLYAKYPNSFKSDDMTRHDERDAYIQAQTSADFGSSAAVRMARHGLTAEEQTALRRGELVARRTTLDLEGLRRQETDVLTTRPSGAALPRRLKVYGSYNLFFLLDYGSYRDIQRHRNSVNVVPLLEAGFGIDPWYLHEMQSLLSAADFSRIQARIAELLAAVEALPAQGVAGCTPMQNQYLLPMGCRVLVQQACSVPQMVYVGELRSGKTVHGSLRPVAQAMLKVLQADLPGIALYGDFDSDSWTAKRGEQTISAKEIA